MGLDTQAFVSLTPWSFMPGSEKVNRQTWKIPAVFPVNVTVVMGNFFKTTC